MISSFGDAATADIYHGRNTKAALKIPRELWQRTIRKLDQLENCKNLEDLTVPPSNHLEKLKGDLAGTYSIRVNDQYRITFKFHQGQCSEVRCMDYH